MDRTPAELRTALDGRYELQREIGAGGIATVYLARDVRHERSVAIEVLTRVFDGVRADSRFAELVRG